MELRQRQKNKKEKGQTLRYQLGEVLSNQIFLATVLCLSTLYFVVTGVQYWATKYLKQAFKPANMAMDSFKYGGGCFYDEIGRRDHCTYAGSRGRSSYFLPVFRISDGTIDPELSTTQTGSIDHLHEDVTR